MYLENLHGGVLITLGNSVTLPDEIKAQLLEKWEMANEDGEVDDLIAEAEQIAMPKAYVLPATIDELEEDHVVLSGVMFPSTLMPQQLKYLFEKEDRPTLFAYTLTCGQELHKWFLSQTDFLLQGVAEDITIRYLGLIGNAMREYVSGTCMPGKHFSAMNPGSLPNWPISQQRPLFALLGDVMGEIGVELTESFLMLPVKSVSGLLFEAAEHYTNCSLCPRDGCPHRRDPFDAVLYMEKYNLGEI